MEYNFIVQRAAEQRVRVADDCGMRGGAATYVQQSFEASGGAFQGKGFDLGFCGVHKASFS